MVESEFNSIVTKSFNNQGGYAYKIPDTFSLTTGYHSKNPYDIFGMYKGKFVSWESKYLQKPQAFNFDRLEDHQIDNLIKSFEIMAPNVLSVFAIGVDFGRGDKRVFLWSNEDLYNIRERKKSKKSLLKKEFESLDNYVKIRKGEIPLGEVLEVLGYPEEVH